MKERILQYLRDNGSITTWEAIKEFGCTRLSHYIYLLRNEGHKIEGDIISTKNRYGEPTHYKKYELIEE